MSTPFGIDFGNYSSVIGVARNRGIDVVVNEVSNRATPSLVGFGVKNRYLGEAARSNEISNLKNTVGSLKRILGRKSDDPALEIEKKFITSELVDVEGLAGVKVRFQGEQKTFNSIQLAAMYLNKLKHITTTEIKGNVSDVVIAVPVWYSEVQRRAAADAAIIAGLNPVRIVNDLTAAAVGYGVFKNSELPEDKPRNVAIVDFGHASYSVSIAAFKKGELKILATAYNRDFGGRDVDLAIANHFGKIFQEKYKIDIHSNPKAFSRVLTQAERLKKILSANTSAPFNIESLMNDIDVSASMTREELEEYIQPFLAQIPEPIERALKDAKLTPADLDSIEVIGGSSRIPSVKEKLVEVFGGKSLSFTLNQDEAVARGAAFICAIHSPTVRVRPFKFEDLNIYSVTYSWEKVEGEDVNELEVFPAGGWFPNSKVITLFRTADFDLEARYTHPETLEKGINAWIGKWAVKGVKPSENGEAVAVKVKLRQDPSGFYTVESAYTAEERTVEEEIPFEGELKEGEEAPEPQYKTVKKWFKKDDLTIVHTHTGLDDAAQAKLLEIESQLTSEDKLVADTEDRKNALEEYIYDIRGKIDDLYKDFASDDEKARLREKADAAEEWLYGDGDDATKAQYIAKYEELASIGNVIRGRYLSKIEEERQAKQAAQEAEKQRIMAEKLQAQKAAQAAAQAEAAAKAAEEAGSQDADGDVSIEN
ncbi:adenyl-nucleotide exchange factor SSE2 [Sugiyamaella lignohabitans]|uniref:Adenyl-nucleotide exchange factor SSE2 n=1 Tax=Sugiyamaella lignohabitans TaxID=796027 RepID=A0A167ECS6_9ASCO|nr:adenyl-nucleotide exchange factor SSE2 [Sugiyamaella lignohabitans]ANB13914.1 adenyl-nucleotide exchange factor SSE2 [Sugiyamaella lignohabitans]